MLIISSNVSEGWCVVASIDIVDEACVKASLSTVAVLLGQESEVWEEVIVVVLPCDQRAVV